MPSEHRLHPFSMLFAFLTQIRVFVIPGLLVAIGASARSDDWWQWQPWMMLFIVPNAAFALVRYLTYTYAYGESELVIRSGLLFRRERHIPYSRIQNIDAVQNLLHRILNVVEVKLETGGGDTVEATMSVLPLADFHEMRERVFSKRHAAEPDMAIAAGATPLVTLSVRELMLCGFLENRGGVLISAAFGLVWEAGLFDRMIAPVFGETASGRGVLRSLGRSIYTNATVSWGRLALTVVTFLAVLLSIRLVSMVWAVVRLHGFKVTLIDDDARGEFGLFTRVAMSIPLRRIQVLTVREGPLHRYVGRVAVKADTAGGHEDKQKRKGDREYLAPILHKRLLAKFVRDVIGVDLDAVSWNSPHPRAFRRALKVWLVIASVPCIVLTFYATWSALLVAPGVFAWAVLTARQTVRHLRWAESGDAVLFVYGWIWRRMVIVRFAKVQVVTLHESPFDRRNAMASLHVDTAGATEGSVVRIPYLARSVADALQSRLALAAAETQLKW